MPGRRADAARLTREDWVDGALAMCVEVGFDRVAAEPLAARLGVTKGSFYWHFANRDELLVALLERWERTRTRLVIEQLDALRATEDADRLGLLVRGSFEHTLTDPTEWAVLAAAANPLVGPVVARVHAARTGYLTELFGDQGLPPERAVARARVLYAAYLGHQMLLAHGSGPYGGEAVDATTAELYFAELTAMGTAP